MVGSGFVLSLRLDPPPDGPIYCLLYRSLVKELTFFFTIFHRFVLAFVVHLSGER